MLVSRKGRKLSLCYSIVYYYNGAQTYEQFVLAGRLYRALTLLALALYHPSASVFSIFMVLYTWYFLVISFFYLLVS